MGSWISFRNNDWDKPWANGIFIRTWDDSMINGNEPYEPFFIGNGNDWDKELGYFSEQ